MIEIKPMPDENGKMSVEIVTRNQNRAMVRVDRQISGKTLEALATMIDLAVKAADEGTLGVASSQNTRNPIDNFNDAP